MYLQKLKKLTKLRGYFVNAKNSIVLISILSAIALCLLIMFILIKALVKNYLENLAWIPFSFAVFAIFLAFFISFLKVFFLEKVNKSLHVNDFVDQFNENVPNIFIQDNFEINDALMLHRDFWIEGVSHKVNNLKLVDNHEIMVDKKRFYGSLCNFSGSVPETRFFGLTKYSINQYIFFYEKKILDNEFVIISNKHHRLNTQVYFYDNWEVMIINDLKVYCKNKDDFSKIKNSLNFNKLNEFCINLGAKIIQKNNHFYIIFLASENFMNPKIDTNFSCKNIDEFVKNRINVTKLTINSLIFTDFWNISL